MSNNSMEKKLQGKVAIVTGGASGIGETTVPRHGQSRGTRGDIICMAGEVAEMAVLDATDYVISKRAVLGLMRSASLQLGKHGIRVNSLSPGMLYTPLVAKKGLVSEDVEKYIGPYTSLKGATLTVKHAADAVAFLASDEAALVTGVDLKVDGGIIAMPFLESN